MHKRVSSIPIRRTGNGHLQHRWVQRTAPTSGARRTAEETAGRNYIGPLGHSDICVIRRILSRHRPPCPETGPLDTISPSALAAWTASSATPGCQRRAGLRPSGPRDRPEPRFPLRQANSIEGRLKARLARFNHHGLLESIGYIPPRKLRQTTTGTSAKRSRQRHNLNLNQSASTNPAATHSGPSC